MKNLMSVFIFLCFFCEISFGMIPKNKIKRVAPSQNDSNAGQPLQVKGQSRSLNMVLVLRNDKDKIKFVQVRENYHTEILDQISYIERTHTHE